MAGMELTMEKGGYVPRTCQGETTNQRGVGGVLGLLEDFHVTNNSSMVSSCNMFLHFDTSLRDAGQGN